MGFWFTIKALEINVQMLIRFILNIVLLLLLGSCHNEKKTHLFTREVCENVFREKYRVYGGGVYGGDIYLDIITDSLSYRQRIGTHFDHENFKYVIRQDSIIITKIEILANSILVIDSFSYNMEFLRQTGGMNW